jgi:N-acetylated-alpha-linked acidic dipeptidase
VKTLGLCSSVPAAKHADLDSAAAPATVPLAVPLAVPTVLAVALAIGACRAGPPATPATPPILGFSATSAVSQRDLETRFRAVPHHDSIRAWHRELTTSPHVATSPRTKEIAEYIAATWKAQGLDDVVIRRYDVLSSNPRRVAVDMVAPVRYTPSLREDPIPEDPDTAQPAISGAWTSFSASGDVTAPVVYANSGNPADYDELRRHGISPKGKIVIVRYSNPYSYRGFKALTAQREGAAAMIVYSDPAEDGYAKGDVYPKGPWGPASHLQRGGIAYDYIVPGDPLTPGWASVEGAKRIPIAEAVSVPTVMALPMSSRDIQPILEKLGGPRAPDAWQGKLPIDYRLGGRDVRLHVTIDMQTDIQPNYVVEGRIRGSERPDEWVVLGNHHDAWVFGGVDPSSGTASMLELTKTLGALKQQGVRPKRTLVFGAWDGEEVTLTGSTEWGEQFRDELRQKAVAYLNVDSAASGPNLDLSAVGTLAPMIVEAARDLTDPSGRSLYEAWRAKGDGGGSITSGARKDGELVVTRIGSGTDHTVFLNHVGVPVVDMSFNGPYGVYHSAYDSHHWVATIGDPGFKYAHLMTQLWGTLALRLANADMLPFDVVSYAAAVDRFIGELDTIPDAANQLQLGGLKDAVRDLSASGAALAGAMADTLSRGSVAPATADRVNRELRGFEQAWLHDAGIPGRPWFKHLLFAPRYTYAAMTLPGVTEAAETGDWIRARDQLALLVTAARAAVARVDAARAALAGR